ncbi:hypothetical protein, partial [Budvicia aquatica]|uniref:hypothetical protein n=1 Tax=Budvicia aquatica TaxID=82979 RepID=UPI000491EBF0
ARRANHAVMSHPLSPTNFKKPAFEQVFLRLKFSLFTSIAPRPPENANIPILLLRTKLTLRAN